MPNLRCSAPGSGVHELTISELGNRGRHADWKSTSRLVVQPGGFRTTRHIVRTDEFAHAGDLANSGARTLTGVQNAQAATELETGQMSGTRNSLRTSRSRPCGDETSLSNDTYGRLPEGSNQRFPMGSLRGCAWSDPCLRQQRVRRGYATLCDPRPDGKARSGGSLASPPRGHGDLMSLPLPRKLCEAAAGGTGGGPARERNLMVRHRHGGRILIDQLAIQSCDTVFCVPGESYLAALDGLFEHPSIRTVVSRQEGAAAMMAEAHGKLTGRPGVCFVTRRTGGRQRLCGPSRRPPGLHADDSVRRSGRPRRPRPRSLPGSRLPPLPPRR